ncbi:hydroxysteroid dehydrogenase-like protein 1 [Trichonephila clavipes]|nr:hydroxysteroid dehydrogenase-like protein 1 [Trichonephila clavipes]
MFLGVSDNRLPLFRPTIFPGHLRYASANLDLVLPVHKHNSLLAELRSAALVTIHERYPDQDILFPSKLEFECKQLINSFLCTRREVVFHLIAAFMEMNKPTSWPKRLRRCIHLAFRCLFETPSDFSWTNCDRREFPLLQTWLLGKSWSCLLDGQRCAQLSALPRVEGVACFRIITGHDYLQARLFKIGLGDSPLCPLCKSVPMTGEHLSDCPALLHILSQDNCGVLLPARATFALYWTARRLMPERTLAGVI